jgi:hypothetical protein
MSTAAKEHAMTRIADIFTPLRELAHRDAGLRRLLCSHHKTIHATAGTHCASCGQRV